MLGTKWSKSVWIWGYILHLTSYARPHHRHSKLNTAVWNALIQCQNTILYILLFLYFPPIDKYLQIMNVLHLCNRENIFICWKMKYSVQLDFTMLNGTFHLSTIEKMFTTTFIHIHYLLTIPYLAQGGHLLCIISILHQ